MARTKAGEAFLRSMDAIPERGRSPLDLQEAMRRAAERMVDAEPVPTMLTLLGAGASAWFAAPPTTLQFPRDHALHPQCGPEWYWLACTLDVVGRGGQEKMGVLICLQRNRCVDPKVQREMGWSDDDAQLVFSYASVIHTTPTGGRSYGRRPNIVWPPLGGRTEMGADPFVFRCGPDHMTGSRDVMPMRVVIDDRDDEVLHMAIDLKVETAMPVETAFFLQGDNGVTPAPRAGFYYSWPQLKVGGRVFVGGQSYEVEGRGWLDHEMMYTPLPAPDGPPTPPPPHWTPPPGIDGWTFGDFNFDNGDALVAAGFQVGSLLPTLPAPYGFYLRPVDGAWQKTPVAGVVAMEKFMPLIENAMLPVSWTFLMTGIEGASLDLAINATSRLEDSSFLAFNQSVQGEAPVAVTLAEAPGGEVAGEGYCESVGYEPPAAFMARALAFLRRE